MGVLEWAGGLAENAVNGFRERIERIQAKIKKERARLRGDHPFNPLQKSVDSPCQQ